ncbi:hypothetical protein [Isoptericola hypogeus]|uniref:hypothetical protein n=1 Tax=Isoptericola hypogeus TaxID=300179 RepID=UPI0031D8C757
MPHDILIPIPADAAARDELVRRVRALTALDHPRVEPVAGAQLRADDRLAVRRGPGAVADLPAVLEVRGRLSAAEAAGLLVAVAQGLAALHSAGLDQGGLTVRDVVLDADGVGMLRPRLEPADGAVPVAGAAASSVVGPGRGGTGDDAAARDVHALATLVAGLVGDRSDDDVVALGAVLAPALAPDPRVRPEAGTLAAHADAALDAEPVHLPERARLAAAALGAGARDRARHGDAEPDADGTAASAGGAGPRSGGVPATRRAVRRPAREPGRDPGGAHPARGVARRRRRRGAGPVGTPTGQPGGLADGPPGGRGSRRGDAGIVRRRRRRGVRRRLPGVVGAMGVAVVVAGLVAVGLEVRQPDEGAGVAAPGSAVAEVAAVPASSVAGGDPAADAPASDAFADVRAVRDRHAPAAAAAALTRSRVALLSGGPGSVDGVDRRGSAAHDADSRLLARVESSGTTVRGAQVEVHGASTRESAGDTALVDVRYEIDAHVQEAADGSTAQVPASGVRRASLGLAWTDDGWRVTTVG